MPGKRLPSRIRPGAVAAALPLYLALTLGAPHAAWALTDLNAIDKTAPAKGGDQADPDANEDQQMDDVHPGLPMPDSLVKKPGQATDGDTDKTDDSADQPDVPVEIILNSAQLPAPVQKLRVAIVEAAASGDIERLRPLLGHGADATQVSIGDAPEDPIAALKSLSGDKEGREVLGILLDIISTSAAHVGKGTSNELYVWPYFAEKPLDSLTPPEIVDLYRIVTAADVADMKEFGSYNFYRIGISPDGKWKFFVAGD